MKRTITNNFLWIIDSDLQQIGEAMPGIAFLLDNKIQAFYQKNQMLLKILHGRMVDFQKKYIQHNEAGKPQYAPVEEGKDKDWLYVTSLIDEEGIFITGEAVGAKYRQLVTDFLNRSISIEI